MLSKDRTSVLKNIYCQKKCDLYLFPLTESHCYSINKKLRFFFLNTQYFFMCDLSILRNVHQNQIFADQFEIEYARFITLCPSNVMSNLHTA